MLKLKRNKDGKFSNIINELTIPLCFVVFFGMSMMFCILYCGNFTKDACCFSICWSLLLCGVLTLLPTIARRIGIVVLITFYALTCLLHAVMYHLFGNFFSFSDLLYTGDGMAFFSFTYIKARKMLWLTAFASIAASIFMAINLKKKKYKIRQAIIGVLLLAVSVAGISFQHNRIMSKVSTQLAWDTAGHHESDADMYQTMSNKNYVMSITGIYHYLYRSFMVSTGLENRLSNGEMYNELDVYYEKRAENEHQSNDMTGILEGKNAFFIMLESIDTWMLTKEYMPNLYRLQQGSINFANHYSPLYISAGTFNTEFIANTSIIPAASGVDTKVYKDNAFPTSIANSFNNAGYTSNSFHSSNPHIYNRGAIHENLGYIKYHNWEDMHMNNYMLDSQMINGYEEMVDGNPFFSFIITYSGHGPYTEESKVISESHIDAAKAIIAKNSIQASDEDIEEYTYAIAHAMETDTFIGELIQQLEADKLLEDTVLIFYTDHYGKYMTNHQLVMDMKGAKNADFLCQTPFFIYHKGTEAKTVETISSTVDIAPTVANMFGLDVEYQYYAGVDVFSDAEHYVIFPGNSWYDGEIYYSVGYQGEMTEKIKARNKEVAETIKYSTYTLKSNYFAHLND